MSQDSASAASSSAEVLLEWSERFTCYTSALSVWLAHRQREWWRPLLSSGPYLGVCRAGALWQFHHSPEPWAPAFGLVARGCDDPDEARAAVDAVRTVWPVIVAGDVYHLPWQQGHHRWHAPHWFVLPTLDGVRRELVDPLSLTTKRGRQDPFQGPIPAAPFAEWAQALPGGNAVHDLRELSVLGSEPSYLGFRYRWLEPVTSEHEPVRGPAGSGGRLEGPDACHALADHFTDHGDNPAAYVQVEDMWQAVRQREFVVAAAEADPDLLAPSALSHWRAGLEQWRRIPGLLLHARLSADAQRPHAARAVVTALRGVAAFEGQHRVGETAVDSDAWVVR